ncbi:MAG: glycosyltransferase family 4 protein [Lachnospiraceae bacterium]|nr:glycosyltransferase family 4 protein [Lachnospiraceae bacterium]
MNDKKTNRICMIVQQKDVHGGIAAVVNGYYGSRLEKDFDITYIESYRNGSRWQKLQKALSAYRAFSRLLKERPPELVHIHSSFGPSFYRKIPFILMCEKKGIPVVNHIHGADFDAFYSNASDVAKKRIRKIYGKCARFIVLSEEWKAHIGVIVPEEKIRIIENYGIPEKGSDIEEWNRERPERKQVLFLGEIGKRKGAFDLPEIITEVLKKVPDVRFVIGGEGETEVVREKLERLGIPEETVRFPGWVTGEEKKKLLRESSLFLLPSYQEGMPMSILDAMSCGLPVVSTNVGGIPKLVRQGENGFLCEAGDVRAMADGILMLLLDEKKRKEAGDRSLRIIEEEYSLLKHIEKLEELYREVLNNRQGSVGSKKG